MQKKQLTTLLVILSLGAGLILIALKSGDNHSHDDHSHDAHDHDHGANEKETHAAETNITIAPATARASGIEIAIAGPAKIKTTLQVNGRVRVNEEQMKHVTPRYPGVLKQVNKRLGDRVAKDELLAVVESNESLQRYEVKSDLAGTIIEKHAVPGEFVRGDDAIFIVADLQTVWIDLHIFRSDAGRVKSGQRVIIHGGPGMPTVEGKIDYISPFGAENTQSLLARVTLENPNGEWRPGLFVTGEIILDETNVPLAVKPGAVQSLREKTAVFINHDTVYTPAYVVTGRRDADWVEITSGMESGQHYVAEGSFVIKADILKSGASHDH